MFSYLLLLAVYRLLTDKYISILTTFQTKVNKKRPKNRMANEHLSSRGIIYLTGTVDFVSI